MSRGRATPASAPRFAEANEARARGHLAVGLQAPAMNTDGEPGCLDYIWLRGAVRDHEAPRWPSTGRLSATPRST